MRLLAGTRPRLQRAAGRRAPVLVGLVGLLFTGGCEQADDAPQGVLPGDAKRQIRSLGYVSGVEKAPQLHGVVVHDPGRAYEGLNFYVAGHDAEAILMDMDGNVLHTWSREDPQGGTEYFWRRAFLQPNGDLLAIHDGSSLVKLDRASNILWEYTGRPHHEAAVAEDGRIYAITRTPERIIGRISETAAVIEDSVVMLDRDGRELQRVSVLEAFEDADETRVLEVIRWLAEHKSPDVTHVNAIEVLDGRISDRLPAFRKGNLLLSSPFLDTIFVLDFEAAKVVWKVRRKTANRIFRIQHHPRLLDNGNILFFANAGPPPYDKSFVYEFDPVTLEEGWMYGDEPARPFYSKCCGTCYRLPNGNTLITETQFGRAFEVTPDKTIVWEFVNPHRGRENDEYIAQLFDLVRLGPDLPLDWLEDAR